MKYKSLYKMHNDKLLEIQKLKTDARKIKNPVLKKEKQKHVEDMEIEYLLSVFEVMKFCNDEGDTSSNALLNSYMKAIGKPEIEDLSIDSEKCKDCNEYYDSVEGCDVCPSCGKCVQALHLPETLSYKELQDVEYKQRFSYVKESHLSEWLDRFQSRENKATPIEVLDIIKNELAKERIYDYSELTEEKIKRILKSLKLNEYYDNIITIINRLSNRPAFVLTPEIDLKIKQMFSQIQYPFQLYKPKNRKNFLSYSYFLNKFFLILKLPEFAQYFRLLKSDDKLRQQDEIFIKIVEHMKKIDTSVDWYFPPSF